LRDLASGPGELGLRYRCALERLPRRLAQRFVELDCDEETRAFLERARAGRAGSLRTLLHASLRRIMSDFDINAVLDVYPMYLLGTAQWRTLLANPGDDRIGRSLLDVGAGSGDVTAALAPLFDVVLTIESSAGMAWRLRRRGFRCARIDVVEDAIPEAPFDAIACLNVLDRCARPRSLLERLRDALAPRGRLLLALALPYSPFVYDGPTTHDPIERLPCDEPEWESAVSSLCDRVLDPLGLEVQALTRVPYLSGGDSRRAVYEHDDVVVVCTKR
jgi:SAM-dependent methyltransferase